MAVGVGLCPCTIAYKLFVPLWGPSPKKPRALHGVVYSAFSSAVAHTLRRKYDILTNPFPSRLVQSPAGPLVPPELLQDPAQMFKQLNQFGAKRSQATEEQYPLA